MTLITGGREKKKVVITDVRRIRVTTTEHLWDVQETSPVHRCPYVVRHLQKLHNTNRVILIWSVWLIRGWCFKCRKSNRTIRNSVDVNPSGSYVRADQEPHFFSLGTQEDLHNTDGVAVLQEGMWRLLSFFTLKRSKLFFLSLGLRSPWRQTQENWWPLLSGPEEKTPRVSRLIQLMISSFLYVCVLFPQWCLVD